MVRTYNRLSHKEEWDPGAMQQAIDACENGLMGYGEASKEFHVPRSILRDRIKKKNIVRTGRSKGFVGGFQPVFSPNQEDELCR